MRGSSAWHANCHLIDAMRRHVHNSRPELKQARAYAALICALLLAALIPAPQNRGMQGNIFTVVVGDYVSPLISSPRGIQALNARLSSFARFVGYDQIHTIVDAGSTRQLASVTRYSGEIFSVLNVEFVLREKPGAIDRPVFISDDFWKRVLGGTPDVLGLSFEASGELYQIAGVIHCDDAAMLTRTEVWIPFSSRGPYGESTLFRVFGELRDGAEWKRSENNLSALVQTELLRAQVAEADAVHLLPIDRKMVVELRAAGNDV